MDLSTPPIHQNTLLSLLIAALTLTLTALTTLRFKHIPPNASPIRVFNIHTGQGLHRLTPQIFNEDAATNRTLWTTVETAQLHAGLERLEPHAWIPPHTHNTEEVVVVCKGVALVYDESGFAQRMDTGAMVHIEAYARHAFRNSGNEPLLIMWLFPALLAVDKFEFRQRYGST